MVKKYRIPFAAAFICIIVILILIGCFMFSPVVGDVNGDGHVSITDYTRVRLDVLGISQLTSAERQRADVNYDGQIDNGDITAIKTMILEAE